MLRWRRCREAARRFLQPARGEEGSAALEFLTVGMVMLVPLVYLVLALGQIQAQTLGVEAAARFAARALAGGQGDPDEVLASVTAQYGIEAFDASVSCAPASTTCPEPGGTVHVTVTAHVPLPFIPPVLGLERMSGVPVQATAVQKVSRYEDAR